MMSGNDNGMEDMIKASSMGLSEVLYECEKELMEKSVIEETISELLDIKIPMLQVEEFGASPLSAAAAGGECSLQKSVSSGCLNSANRMNGMSSVRPNFLEFQGLDFEAVARAEEGLQRGRHSGTEYLLREESQGTM